MSFRRAAERFIESLLVEPLLHGDEEHREWLRKELRSKVDALAEAMLEEARDWMFDS